MNDLDYVPAKEGRAPYWIIPIIGALTFVIALAGFYYYLHKPKGPAFEKGDRIKTGQMIDPHAPQQR